ncbi:MAG: hypothetical protein KDC95_06540 [Planctomycetes bacterium]|nr:hypothetical protein [Planctomycetota bacterium]
MSMRAALLGLPMLGIAFGALADASLASQDAPPRLKLDVTYVGSKTGRRAQSFAEFLRARVRKLRVVDLSEVGRADLTPCDVVLLDWEAREQATFEGKSTPLGDRASWNKPTIFLGRTGMDMAIRWDLEGWFG